MGKLSLEELKKVEQFTRKQWETIRKAKNKAELEQFVYPFVTSKELKVLDKVFSKIKQAVKLEQEERELDAEEETIK